MDTGIIRLNAANARFFINRLHATSGRGSNYAMQPRHAGIN